MIRRLGFFVVVTQLYIGGALPEIAAEVLRVEPVGISAVNASDVPARVGGSLRQIHVAAGDVVKEGMTLATLDDDDAQLELQRAKIDLRQALEIAASDVKVRSAESAVLLAKLDLQRAEKARSRYPKSVTQSQLDRLQALMTRAELELEQAQFERQQQNMAVKRAENAVLVAEEGVRKRQILAPINGRVVVINARRGEWVEPGATVIRIVDPSRLRAEGFVEPNSVSDRLNGRDAVLTVDRIDGKDELRGRVTFVSPEVNRVDGHVRLWVEVDNPKGTIVPGTTGRVEIQLDDPSGDASARR